MKILKTLCIVFVSIMFFTSCKTEQQQAIATITAKSSSNVKGTVTFTEKDGKIMMSAKINGLTPGTHAIHIHENGDCSSDDGKSAGGHWNPTKDNHGK